MLSNDKPTKDQDKSGFEFQSINIVANCRLRRFFKNAKG